LCRPRFDEKSYRITVYAPLRARQEIIKVAALGGDLDETDKMHYQILSGNEEGNLECFKFEQFKKHNFCCYKI